MCNCKWSCSVAALIISAIIGVVAAFLQILGVITVGTAFLWVALGIAVVYLAVLFAGAVLRGGRERPACLCRVTDLLLTGILGTALLSLILLAVGIVATSVFSAIAVGVLLFFLWLTLSASACYIRCLLGCGA